MFSRYDAMRESVVQDSADKESYPDPLSLNFNNFTLTKMPKRNVLGIADIDRFWLSYQRYYKDIAEGDDVLLSINNIPYRGMLRPGDAIYMPDKEDIYNVTEARSRSNED